MSKKPTLLFVSPRFLFPTDCGGKIRTTQVLRGLKGGHFHIKLVMPAASPDVVRTHQAEIDTACDELLTWHQPVRAPLIASARRVACLLRKEPVSVATDYCAEGAALVREMLHSDIDLVVFDYPHSSILAPARINPPSVLFTHNVEAEIFHRQWQVAASPMMKLIWGSQCRKMRRYEQSVLSSFSSVISVSERDEQYFRRHWNIDNCTSISTGVDLDFFQYEEPRDKKRVVFCGSMDSMSNIDGVIHFFREVWPLVLRQEPEATMTVVGRNPPAALVDQLSDPTFRWQFTGYVNDVREHVSGADAFVIPLRVGGGTRIKAFEAMAMGCPVVSTKIGMEGLPVLDGTHFLQGDSPATMASHVVTLLRNEVLRKELSTSARAVVEKQFGFHRAAREFETICVDTLRRAHYPDAVKEGVGNSVIA